jgi:MFS family permease
VSTVLISFGFFGAIIFLPRWFQFVAGSSATESGYQVLPLLAGLILSSIVAGMLVSRTGRYKLIILSGLALMTFGIFLMTFLHADTPLPIVWLWMFVTGLGIGPTLSVYTIVVQNAVPFRQLGVATSNLTFFRQIGGSVGLAITGTVFGTSLVDQVPVQMSAAGVPQPLVTQFANAGSGALEQLTGVGSDLGARILATVPDQFRPMVEPFIGQIVFAIHEAFTIAITHAFWIGAAATAVSFMVALALREIPLRSHHGDAVPDEATSASSEARRPLSSAPAID